MSKFWPERTQKALYSLIVDTHTMNHDTFSSSSRHNKILVRRVLACIASTLLLDGTVRVLGLLLTTLEE